MINLKNIVKVLLLALFICAYSGEGLAYNTRADDAQGNPQKQTTDIVAKEADQRRAEDAAKDVATTNGEQTAQDATFCGSEFGVFKELVQTGQKIFKRLRDLIYVVAGFGIIAVAVGGFFGNLNWKWLGAIVISLVVVATAGELVVLMTGCEQFSASLVTNTLQYEAPMTTENYNRYYTEGTPYSYGADIEWDDTKDKHNDDFLSVNSSSQIPAAPASVETSQTEAAK